MSPKRLEEVLRQLKEGDMTAGIQNGQKSRKDDEVVNNTEQQDLDSRLNALGSPLVRLNRN